MRQIQITVTTAQTAKQIKIDFDKFSIGLRHIIIDKNI